MTQAPYPQHPPMMQPMQPPPKKKRTGLIVALVIVGVVLIALIGSCAAFLGTLSSSIDSATSPTAVEATSSDESDEGAAAEPTEPAETSADTEEPKDEPTEPYELTITKCQRGDFGTFDVDVKIKNLTDEEVTYLFEVGLYDTKDNTVGSGFGTIEVRPGKSGSTSTFASLSDEKYKGKVKCSVEVTNF